MGFDECYKIPIVCHIVHLMREGIIKKKTGMDFAFDLQEVNKLDQEESLKAAIKHLKEKTELTDRFDIKKSIF